MYLLDTANNEPSHFASIAPKLNTGQYIAFATLTIAFWLLTHPYPGIWHDAILYTAQALNILHPEIYQGDIFFKYGSQASFTIFPILHALLIEQIGVDNSALLLAIIGQVLFFTGSISLARHYLTSGQTILFLIIFTTLPVYINPLLTIFEVFATSRGISAGLSLLSLVYFLNKRITTASVLLIIALLLHPLMPLGAIAIALFLQRPKVVVTLISLGVVLIIIGYTFSIPPISYLSQTIDNEWRELILQRAPFLLIEHWPSDDLNLLVLEMCIILSARAYCTDKLKVAFNAVLIAAAACILISFLAGWLSNLLLIQLQTWRILLFVHIFSTMALAWLISVAWKKDCGKLVILFYSAIFLSFDATGGLPALAVHLFWVWSLKRNPTLPPILLKGAYIILAQGIFWYILKTEFVDPLTIALNPGYAFINNIIYSLKRAPFYITALLLALFLYSRHSQKALSIYLSIAILITAPIAIFFFDQRFRNCTWDEGNTEPYITLRKEIPENATVYCEHDIQTCWFALRRQHYMSPYQSAGIVFSKKTAVETKRRANLLFNAGYDDGIFTRHWKKNNDDIMLPEPTYEAFNELCQDPALDYIFTRHISTPKAPDKVIKTAQTQFYIYNCSQIAAKN